MVKSKYIISILILIIFSVNGLRGQVTIGSAVAPNDDALLDLQQLSDGLSGKGLLLPRVRLVETTRTSPLSTHVEGMLVYNIADTLDVTSGLYYNNGSAWMRIDPLSGGQADQAIVSDNNLDAAWGELDFPDESSIGYVMNQFAVSNIPLGDIFTEDKGYGITAQDRQYDSDEWTKLNITPVFSVTPKHIKNRLIVTMQTMIHTNRNVYYPGWIDYAAGVFINDELKVVKLGQFSHTGTYAFEIVTMYLIVEDLSVNTLQNVEIAVSRLNSKSENEGISESIGIGVPVETNLNSFMAKPFISIQYYEDPSSPTTN